MATKSFETNSVYNKYSYEPKGLLNSNKNGTQKYCKKNLTRFSFTKSCCTPIFLLKILWRKQMLIPKWWWPKFSGDNFGPINFWSNKYLEQWIFGTNNIFEASILSDKNIIGILLWVLGLFCLLNQSFLRQNFFQWIYLKPEPSQQTISKLSLNQSIKS